MLKNIRYLLIITCILLQACQHNKTKEENEEEPVTKTDLSKAASYNLQLGLGYLKQGDRPRAKKKLLTALEQAPGSPDVNAAMAYYFEQTKEVDQAKKYYMKAISLSSNSGAQLNNYGTFLCRQGEFAKAESYFLKAIKDMQYVNTAGAYENAGLCTLDIPDNAKARLYFTKALSQDPSKNVSLYELVKLESREGNDKQALNLLQQHPDLVLNDQIFLALAKEVAIKAGQTNIAIEYANNYKRLEQKIDNSGVDNEYSNHTG